MKTKDKKHPMIAKDKKPPMIADDFFYSAKERLAEAKCLYDNQIEDPDKRFWIAINFLSVVAVECFLTAFMLYEDPNAGFITNHDIGILLSKTSLAKNKSIDKAVGVIKGYWKHWPQDLRFLSYGYFIMRVKHHSILEVEKHNEAPKIIGERMYISAKNIIKEAEKIWIWKKSKKK